MIWALYFDHFPHGHYGTIRQQIWSLLHFPFQLAIVGVVEGSQQLALARYVLKNYNKIDASILKYCVDENLGGEKLRDSLLKLLDYWDFDGKYETYGFQNMVSGYIYDIGNSTGICSPANATEYASTGEWPQNFYNMTLNIFDGVYIGLGMKLPIDKLEKYNAINIAAKSWSVVYLYYWVSICVLVSCSIVFLLLIRRHKADLFDFVSVGSRLIALAVGGAMIALTANDNTLYSFLSSPAVLPACLALLFLIRFFDKLSATFCNWHLKGSGQPYAKEYDEDHHHGSQGSHSETHEHAHATGHAHHDSLAVDRWKSAAWSTHSDTQPLTATSTEYHSVDPRQSYAMTPLISPPIASPPPAGGYMPLAPGGYMPVGTGQNYGA